METRGGLFYLLNYKTNPNMSAAKFWDRILDKLLRGKECLIVQINGKFYVAESFNKSILTTGDCKFYDIMLENDVPLKWSYYTRDVIYLNYHLEDAVRKIKSVDALYESLISTAVKGYKRQVRTKAILKIDKSFPKTAQADKELDDLVQHKIKSFIGSETDKVMQLSAGVDYEEIDENNKNKKSYATEIQGYISDCIDQVAMLRNIPPKLLRGDVADTKSSMQNFITLCINPLTRYLSREFTMQLYSEKQICERTYLEIDTTCIKAADITEIAGSLDILMRNGAYTLDDCLRILGKQPIGGKLGGQRFITKNLCTIEDMTKGSDKNG